MKRFLAIAVLAVLTACASVAPSVNGQLKAAYDTTNAYVEVTKTSLQRGRITPEQAARASANAKNALAKIDMAAAVLATCKPPCNDYVTIMQGLQPSLLELEAELRKREKESK
jgi:hypothetical protein